MEKEEDQQTASMEEHLVHETENTKHYVIPAAENSDPPVQGPAKFSQQRTWNLVEDLKEKERDIILKEISSCLKTIEKRLERMERLSRLKLFDADTD